MEGHEAWNRADRRESARRSRTSSPGWVFRDPWNKSLWPFVAPSLEYAQTGRDENGLPRPRAGNDREALATVGMDAIPTRRAAGRKFPGGGFAAAGTPDAREILRAALRHQRLERRSRHFGGWEDEDIEAAGPAGRDLNRISSIEAEPEPVFLVSYLYVPRDGDDGDLDWHACDFFGRGSDPALRRLVFRVAAADEKQHLARRLDRLLGRTLHGDFDSLRRAVTGREHQARRLLDQGPDDRRPPPRDRRAAGGADRRVARAARPCGRRRPAAPPQRAGHLPENARTALPGSRRSVAACRRGRSTLQEECRGKYSGAAGSRG